eukprot:TRINITY_DN7280_c0_g1_i20.p2 TRINITY_DN7280_c0_g1~~TRINITY_DN7280_c0_g1_i20.p2  ORF type:complete len:191 (-),score=34.73 TRINITY_DN7280_c0_g1_i20:164-736(-)
MLHALIRFGVQATDQHIRSILCSALIDFFSLLCTLYGTFMFSTEEENDHLAILTISFILLYGYAYAIRFTFMEIVILCVIVPLIGLFFRSTDAESIEDRGTPRELLEMLEEKCKRTARSSSDLCIICMRNYAEDDKVILMPCDPRHCFHEECILTWLEQNNTCPICKSEITIKSFQMDKFMSNSKIFATV